MKPFLFGIFALLVLAACGASQDGSSGTAGMLPNSLSDTSAHTAQQDIPSYGPQRRSDSSRSAGSRHEARGQVLYVPVYSHIFHRGEGREFDLTTTLSIRNTSSTGAISLRKVDYFDSEGTLLKSYLDRPRTLGPLASTYVVIEEGDRSGGVGANFMMEWEGRRSVTPPLVEAVMISTASSQGISFTSAARVLQEW